MANADDGPQPPRHPPTAPGPRRRRKSPPHDSRSLAAAIAPAQVLAWSSHRGSAASASLLLLAGGAEGECERRAEAKWRGRTWPAGAAAPQRHTASAGGSDLRGSAGERTTGRSTHSARDTADAAWNRTAIRDFDRTARSATPFAEQRRCSTASHPRRWRQHRSTCWSSSIAAAPASVARERELAP